MAKEAPTSIRFSPEMLKRVRAYASARRWPLSRLIEHICREWLDYQERGAAARRLADRHNTTVRK